MRETCTVRSLKPAVLKVVAFVYTQCESTLEKPLRGRASNRQHLDCALHLSVTEPHGSFHRLLVVGVHTGSDAFRPYGLRIGVQLKTSGECKRIHDI